jgi:hypothetical protein
MNSVRHQVKNCCIEYREDVLGLLHLFIAIRGIESIPFLICPELHILHVPEAFRFSVHYHPPSVNRLHPQ